jgi:hypothetical protein
MTEREADHRAPRCFASDTTREDPIMTDKRKFSRSPIAMAALALSLWGAVSPAQASAQAGRLPIRVAALPADHFARAVTVNDDQLEPYVSFSSQGAHKGQQALGSQTEGDLHLTARVDRGTGAVSYRVWHEITSTDAPRELTRVHYRAEGKVTQSELSVARHWESNCVPRETGGQCDQRMRIAFDVPEQVMREIAASHQQGSRAGWAFRYKDAHGSDLDGVLAPAEAAGLIRAVDGWRADHKS